MTKGTLWAIGAVLALALYATLIEPNWIDVSHYSLGTKNSADPIKVLHLSDLQLDDIGYRERRVLEVAKEQQADVVVLSGDIVEAPQQLPVLDRFLTSLEGRHKVAVLGNWEHWGEVDLVALRKLYEARGVSLLVNQTKELQIGKGRRLIVHGIDDFTGGRPDEATLQQTTNGAATLVVQHSPGWFDRPEVQSAPNRFDLCLSGHTHGGQVTLFGLPIWLPRGSGTYVAGLYDTPKCPLYVSKGVGTSILPIRFWARPEILVFEVR